MWALCHSPRPTGSRPHLAPTIPRFPRLRPETAARGVRFDGPNGSLGSASQGLAHRANGEFANISAWDEATAHRVALALAARFGAEAEALIGATTPAAILRQDLWVAPARWRLSSGRAVLIGDAAHAMAPNLGRGACESILDAVALGQALNTMDVPRALRHYQRTRAARTQGLRAASSLAMRVSMLERGAGLRDRLVRLPGVRHR